MDNDVNIMALGEMHAGLARTVDDLLFVKVGTGVGCGIIVDGKVYRGVSGSAGDIGHIRIDDEGPVCACGNVGCLEAHFSGAALARDATEAARAGRSEVLAERLAATGVLTGADVAVAAAAGDQVAVGLVRDGGRRLGLLAGRTGELLQPRDDRARRRGRGRARSPAAGRVAQRRLPTIPPARHGQSSDRAVGAGIAGRRRRRGSDDLGFGAVL